MTAARKPEADWLKAHAPEIWGAACDVAATFPDPFAMFCAAPNGSLWRLMEWVEDKSRELKPGQAPAAARLVGQWQQVRRGKVSPRY